MKIIPFSRRQARPRFQRGFTLIEMSLVMALILGLIALAGISVSAVQSWNKGKNASIALQAVYSAQRSYLADHPSADITTVTGAALTQYLPTGWTALPVMTGIDGQTLTLDHTVMPPVFRNGEAVYDPSQNPKDGLWDTGG